MGLFKSKSKTTVGTTVSRVIENKSLPDAVRTGVSKAIIQDSDIVENILEETFGSIGIRAARYYRYGRDTYTHGLPQGAIKSTVQVRGLVTSILSGIEGATVSLDYFYFQPANYLHVAWKTLADLHGYHPVTNVLHNLSTVNGQPTYLANLTVKLPASIRESSNPSILEQWGSSAENGFTPESDWLSSSNLLTPALVIFDSSITVPEVLVSYVWKMPNTVVAGVVTAIGEIKKGSMTLPMGAFVDETDHYQGRYFVNATIVKYFIYKAGSGTYPALDDFFSIRDVAAGTFYPFLYFRYNKVSEITDKTTAAYKTSKKLAKYVGLNYDTVADGINKNPDIADVQQAMMIMAVPAITENELERAYLFSFFENLFYGLDRQFSSVELANAAKTLNKNISTDSNIVIQDKRFTLGVRNTGVYKRRRVGRIAAVGKHFSRYNTETTYTEVKVSNGNDSAATIRQQAIVTSFFTYSKQITETLYDELKVTGLEVIYYVGARDAVIANDEEKILLIPLDRSITSSFGVIDREELYSRSLHFVFNSLQVTKIKWYQTGFFKFLLVLVAVVITFFTGGADGGALLAAVLSGSTAALTTIALIIIEKLLIGLIIQMATKLFVKIVGVRFAFLIALVGIAVGGFQAIGNIGVSGAPWASQLLQLSTNLVKAVGEAYQDMMKDLLKDISAFSEYTKEALKTIETAQQLLERNNFMQPGFILGEKPGEFFDRTIHSGNIGVMGIQAISSYVDIALTLPKIDKSLGESQYDNVQ